MMRILLTLVLALSCTLGFAKKDPVKVYTNDDDKKVVQHTEMECFDDMSDEAYLMWIEGEGYKLAFRVKKETLSGEKSMDITLEDGTVIKAKGKALDAEKTYNPWIGWVYVTDFLLPLDDKLIDACLNGKVKQFALFHKGRGDDPYTWDRKRKWNFDKNFKTMYEAVNKKK